MRSTQQIAHSLFSPTVQQVLALPTPGDRGIASDDGTGHSLDTIELAKVLAKAAAELGGPLELLGMDACLMSNHEVAYQAREHVRAIVGSEDLEPGDGWPYTDILRRLADEPTLDRDRAGRRGGRGVPRARTPSRNDTVTQCAVDVSRLAPLTEAFEAFTTSLRAVVADRGPAPGDLRRAPVVGALPRPAGRRAVTVPQPAAGRRRRRGEGRCAGRSTPRWSRSPTWSRRGTGAPRCREPVGSPSTSPASTTTSRTTTRTCGSPPRPAGTTSCTSITMRPAAGSDRGTAQAASKPWSVMPSAWLNRARMFSSAIACVSSISPARPSAASSSATWSSVTVGRLGGHRVGVGQRPPFQVGVVRAGRVVVDVRQPVHVEPVQPLQHGAEVHAPRAADHGGHPVHGQLAQARAAAAGRPARTRPRRPVPRAAAAGGAPSPRTAPAPRRSGARPAGRPAGRTRRPAVPAPRGCVPCRPPLSASLSAVRRTAAGERDIGRSAGGRRGLVAVRPDGEPDAVGAVGLRRPRRCACRGAGRSASRPGSAGWCRRPGHHADEVLVHPEQHRRLVQVRGHRLPGRRCSRRCSCSPTVRCRPGRSGRSAARCRR